MGDKNIKKEVKRKKKADIKTTATSSVYKPVAAQPELIKKEKKQK